jgi:signal transduction histidine kinase
MTSPAPKPPIYLVQPKVPVDADEVAPHPENQPPPAHEATAQAAPQPTEPQPREPTTAWPTAGQSAQPYPSDQAVLAQPTLDMPAAFTMPLAQPLTQSLTPSLAQPLTQPLSPPRTSQAVQTAAQPEDDAEKARPTLVSRGFRAAGFMLAGFPLNLAAFIFIVTFFSVGVSTLVIWLGLVVLLIATKTVFGFAAANRALIRSTLGVDIPTPKISYGDTGSFWQRYLRRLTHPQMWRNLAYLLLAFPLACFEFPLAIVGVVILPVGLFVLPVVAAVHILLARALLGPNENEELTQKAEHLQASRARGVDAAEAERRRIERDLHDAAQQRLVAVAMGRAKIKMDADPEAAKALVDEALSDAKLAVSELRDLARGIYPAVLGDRGLDAALSSLAAKCPIPVEVNVRIDPRPPAAVESTAYFIVGECLTNIAKHAGATEVRINAWREERPTGDQVVVEITDDGRGGASMRPGGGLSGLADRAATIDGVMTVVSPVGGPTVIRADLPCVW